MKELYTAAGIFVVLILLGVWMVQNNRNEQEKKLVQLRKKWGKKQEKRTAREKKEKLEACLRRKAGDNSCVDAITWNDLDLDAVFDTVDHTVSVCGEEYLYTALRMPVTATEIREERERLIDAEWQQPEGSTGKEKYSTEIKIFANNRIGMFVEISKVFTERPIDITSMNSRTNKQGKATITLTFDIHGVEELNRLTDKLRQIEGVIDIERTAG